MRSTLKCDIIRHIKWGICFMKTKIIYISGNEVFDMNDIRAAFEEVRVALNLDKNTVLFGVPVDEDDAGLMSKQKPENTEITPEIQKPVIEEVIKDTDESEEISEPIEQEIIPEPVVIEQPKRRGRPRKEEVVVEESEPVVEETESEIIDSADEKVVPILSVLSTNDEPSTQEIDIIPEIHDEKVIEETIIDEPVDEPVEDVAEEPEEIEDEADLEKLLSAMTPLQEDILEKHNEPVAEPIVEEDDDISVDATLEQLATEFAETQDKIATENKSASRSKIGKLRNILPFKQSKHKDQGLGDLFGWAGIAANDEDFSVPGFFTNAASKK